MKYLKKFNDMINESYNENEIDTICEKYGIKNYIINEVGSIDVDGDVDISFKRLTKLPLNFRNVSGDFNCGYNQLTSLEGVPQQVDGDFICYYNKLSDLKYTPIKIGKEFNCSHNRITSLQEAPQHVGGDFDCSYNKITSLQGAPQQVDGDFICHDNDIKNINILPIDYKSLIMYHNFIFIVLEVFINFINKFHIVIENTPENKELINKFNEKQIIKDDILYIDLLVEFLEEVGKPQTKEYLYDLLKHYYEIR